MPGAKWVATVEVGGRDCPELGVVGQEVEEEEEEEEEKEEEVESVESEVEESPSLAEEHLVCPASWCCRFLGGSGSGCCGGPA